MESRIVSGRIQVKRSAEEKKPLLQRLKRIEGQVRGLMAMIEQDRYCLDKLQQINATTAALGKVAIIIAEQHVTAGVQVAARERETAVAMDDVMTVLRSAMRGR